MNEIVLKVDATFGPKVKIGDKIHRGDIVGVIPNSRRSLRAPVGGIIKEVSFCSQDHSFTIILTQTADCETSAN
jgi:hypothetical protein